MLYFWTGYIPRLFFIKKTKKKEFFLKKTLDILYNKMYNITILKIRRCDMDPPKKKKRQSPSVTEWIVAISTALAAVAALIEALK